MISSLIWDKFLIKNLVKNYKTLKINEIPNSYKNYLSYLR